MDGYIKKLEDGNLSCTVCGKISADRTNSNKLASTGCPIRIDIYKLPIIH